MHPTFERRCSGFIRHARRWLVMPRAPLRRCPMRKRQNGRPVGRVVGLWRYPVKSMGGEPVAAIDVSWHGFKGDRRWAFIRDGVTQSGFPWLTLRERGDMSHYTPSFADPTQPDQSPVIVRTPSGGI